ncbi:hypothetical protein DFH28DRAFT_921929 [Melampsora americana]|nr:hypothetical protein DFH28DRAFT_921929 [Melampsora americana]
MVTVQVFYESSPSSLPPPSSSLPAEPTSSPVTHETQATSLNNNCSSSAISPMPVLSSSNPPQTAITQFPHYPCLSPGPDHVPRSSPEPRKQSIHTHQGLTMPDNALPAVQKWIDQCFYCGQFGHRQARCPLTKRERRKAEHFNDWRLVRFSKNGPRKSYSVLALWPSIIAIEASPQDVGTQDNRLASDLLDTVHEAIKSTGMIIDRPMTKDRPPAIPWATRPMRLSTSLCQIAAPIEDVAPIDVFWDAGCSCAFHDYALCLLTVLAI